MLSLSNDGAEFGGSIYQKVSDKLETAVNLAWTTGSNSTRFGIAAKYQLDKDASISVSTVAMDFQWSPMARVPKHFLIKEPYFNSHFAMDSLLIGFSPWNRFLFKYDLF